MSKNSHRSNPPLTQNQTETTSDDPANEQRLSDNSDAVSKAPTEPGSAHDTQNQATTEEFGREGMGVAAKE
jgi:hypothetical protein